MCAFSEILIERGFYGQIYEDLMIACSEISVRKNKKEEYFYSDVLGGCNKGLS